KPLLPAPLPFKGRGEHITKKAGIDRALGLIGRVWRPILRSGRQRYGTHLSLPLPLLIYSCRTGRKALFLATDTRNEHCLEVLFMKNKFPWQLFFVASLVPALLAWVDFANAAEKSLPRSSPEEQGVSSAAVRAYFEAADKEINTLHSVM